MGIKSQALRDSAKGQPCTFEILGVCNHDPETTVLCHIRDESKALGKKANDWSGAFGCSACHEAIDQHKLSAFQKLWYSHRALQRTITIWRDMGLLLVAGDNPKPRKPSSKIMPRRALAIATGEDE